MFDSAYAYVETQDHDSVDAVVLLGDIVDDGTAEQYDELAKVLASANIKSETEVLALMGNHEWWTEKTTGADLYLEGIADIDVIQEKELKWSKNIGGYQFIGNHTERRLLLQHSQELSWHQRPEHYGLQQHRQFEDTSRNEDKNSVKNVERTEF